jgi:exodeoxyribonuclease VII small subunit
MTKPKPVSSFRGDLEELESITQRLEDESIDLDEALVAFERGNELVGRLKTQLEAAELRVKAIGNQSDKASQDKKD